tara:strand:+ start:272 stop:1540 length:1269 start_codon:yes stop_codon:yes gene_type:complete
MPLSFFIHSKKEQAPIWIRLREGRKIDVKARTLITIPTERFVKGKVLLHRIVSGAPGLKASLRKQNDSLNIIQTKMDELRLEVQNALNSRNPGDIVTKEWLMNIIQPQQDTNLLATNIQSFLDIKSTSVKTNTFIIYKRAMKVLGEYEAYIKTPVSISSIDLNFRDKFLVYLREQGYSNNTIILYIRTLVAVLKFSKKRGISVTNELEYFSDGLKKRKTLNVYLTLEEIDDIIKLEGLNPREDISRDWLVISCFTGQRSGDLFNFNKDNLNAEGDVLSVQQSKNENSKPISIPLLPQVITILNKYDGEFPPLLSANKKNNYKYYNELIKIVCKKANIIDDVKTLAYKSEANNSSIVSKEKYKLIGTHVGRRSFCTNFYGKIPTPLLMNISGHQNESTLLLYINADRIIDLDDLRNKMVNALK